MSAPTPSRNPSQPAADNIIQQAGIIVAGYSPSSADDKTRDILGALLKYAPSASGRSNVAEEIIATPSCKAFADYFVTSFLFPLLVRASHLSGPKSPDEAAARAMLKEHLLRRDNNRCVVSCVYDTEQWKKLMDQEQLAVAESDWTETAYIIPLSLGSTSKEEHEANAAIWEFMLRIFPEVGSTPSIGDINSPTNTFTLLESLHRAFNTFKFCLEATDTPNTYRICTFFGFPTRQMASFPTSRIVTLTSHGPYPLPNPNLFRLHVAIAHILNAAGMSS